MIFRFFVLAVILLVSFIVLIGCNGSDTIIYEPYVYVTGYVSPKVDDSLAYCSVRAMNLPSIPELIINDQTYRMIFYENLFYYYSDELPVEESELVNIQINFNKPDGDNGSVMAEIMLPESVEIISENESDYDTVQLGDDLEVFWTKSENADYYEIVFYINYHYMPDTINYRSFNCRVDTILTDTTVYLEASIMLPDQVEIDSIYYYGFYNSIISVRAASGPHFVGDIGNVTGDGTGIFNGYSNRKEKRFIFILP